MKAYRLWVLLAVLSLAMGLSLGCMADDDDDDSGDDDSGGDDDTIDNVPDEVNDFLDQADLNKLEEGGMTIYTGDDPPDIQGTYLLDSLEVTYDESDLEGMTIATYTMTYYDQTASGEIKNDYEAPDVGDSGNGIGGFIAGENNCFTAFFDFTGDASGCQYHMPALHSGCKSDDGITGFQWGFIMKSKTGSNCDLIIPEGAARIVSETDNLAAKQ